ncbi:MAG TPA: hypothetical protein DCL63_13350 [Firmicutes bacterium]|nr:hypothetical protein [Bacillota bacterium]HBK61290.1 hypothetical protein [Bacillota bacterium]
MSIRGSDSLLATLARTPALEVFLLSPDLVILSVNEAAAEAMGMLVSSMMGRRIDEILPGLCRRVKSVLPKLERTGSMFVDERAPEIRQGRTVLYDTYISFVRDMLEDSLIGWVLIRSDATGHASLQRVVDAFPVALALLRTPECRIELANSHFAALTGKSESLAGAAPSQPEKSIAAMAIAAARSGEYLRSSISWSHGADSGRRTNWTVYCCPLEYSGRHSDAVVVIAQQTTARVSMVRKLDILRRMSSDLTESVDVSSFLHTAVSACASFLSATYCAIIQRDSSDPGKGRLLRLAQSSPVGLLPESAPLDLCPRLTSVMLSKETSYLDFQHDEAPRPPQCAQAGIRACIAFPVAAYGKCYGQMVVAFTDGRGRLEPDDLYLAELVAVYCALAMEHGQTTSEHAQLAAARREALSETQQKTALLSALLDSLEDGLLIVSADERVTLINESAAAYMGLCRDETHNLSQIHARSTLMHMDGTPIPESERPTRKLLQGRGEVKGDYIMVARDGSSRVLNFGGGVVRDAFGSIASVIVIARDRTELVQAERISQDYLRFVSHDLRSPLTLISARAQMLEKSAEHADAVRRNAQSILRAARQMNTMISDLTDSVRLESGHALPVRLRIFDLPALLSELIQRWKETPDGNRIQARLPHSMPRVYSDPDGVERILSNLMSNALKYSPDDQQVTVSATVADGEAVISIADRGPGISAEDAGHLFERYFRSEDARKHHDGLGLGLHISRALAEAQGGRIWAESEPGQGSIFSFTIPLSSSSSRS